MLWVPVVADRYQEQEAQVNPEEGVRSARCVACAKAIGGILTQLGSIRYAEASAT
jgi:hypothetical protein